MELKNKIKISLFLGNVENAWEGTRNKEKFFTVRKFNYELLKSRHELGTPNEITERTTIDFEIKSPKIVQLQKLYNRIKLEEPSWFSFVFNPVFGIHDELEAHNGAMMIEGCLCRMGEIYVSREQYANERMLMSASLMIYSMHYIGGTGHATSLSLTLI